MSLLNISKVDVELDPTSVEETINSLIDSNTMTKIHELFAETIDPWTPFLSGALHSDITVSEEGVTYNVPYSAEKYYGTVFCKLYHPLATDHWDKEAMETEMEAFEAKVKDILIERVRQVYG